MAKTKVVIEDPIKVTEVDAKIGNRIVKVKKPRIHFDQKNPKSKSKTHQSFREEVKIQNIMKNYGKTGILGDPLNQRKPVFGDFTDLDFTTMQQQVADVKSQFERLPGALKSKFDNDPQKLIEFLANKDNEQEAIRLGFRDDPKRFEPYMMVDKNGVSTGVMKHPGKTAEETKYYIDGKLCDKTGNLIVEDPKPTE